MHLSLSILITKCKIITGEFQKAYIYFVPFDSIHFRTVCLWKLLMLTTGVVFHDAIYQFLRIFYHSRFKPDNLQMTLAQWAMPIVDLVFLVGPLLQIKRFRHFHSMISILDSDLIPRLLFRRFLESSQYSKIIFQFFVFDRTSISSVKSSHSNSVNIFHWIILCCNGLLPSSWTPWERQRTGLWE